MISMVISRLISWANPLGFQQIYWIFMGLIYWFKAMLTNEERKKKSRGTNQPWWGHATGVCCGYISYTQDITKWYLGLSEKLWVSPFRQPTYRIWPSKIWSFHPWLVDGWEWPCSLGKRFANGWIGVPNLRAISKIIGEGYVTWTSLDVYPSCWKNGRSYNLQGCTSKIFQVKRTFGSHHETLTNHEDLTNNDGGVNLENRGSNDGISNSRMKLTCSDKGIWPLCSSVYI